MKRPILSWRLLDEKGVGIIARVFLPKYTLKAMMQLLKQPILIMTGLLLLTAILYISKLDDLPLWTDEGWTVAVASADTPAAMFDLVRNDVHPPLYFAALWAWEKIAGESELALRAPTVFTLLIEVALLYQLGAKLLTPFSGIMAALLLILHDLVRVLALEVRQYTLSHTLVVLVLWTYWRWREKPDRRHLLFFILAALALLYTHYWGALVLIGVGIHCLIVGPQHLRYGIIIAGAIVALGYAPWLPIIPQQMEALPDGLAHVLPNDRRGLTVMSYQLIGVPEWFWVVLGGAALVLAWRSRQRQAISFLALGVCVPIVLSVAINAFYATLWYRSLMVIIPPLLLLISYTLSRFRLPERSLLMGFIVIQSVFTTSALPPTRGIYPPIAYYLGERSAPQDAVIAAAGFDSYAFLYYVERQPANPPTLNTHLYRRAQTSDYVDAIRQTVNNVEGVWVVREWYDTDAILWDTLSELGFIQTAAFNWQTGLPINLVRWDRLPDAPPLTHYDDLVLLQAKTFSYTDTIGVQLWWQARQVLPHDYTVSVFLLDASGRLVAQSDHYPQEGRARTSTWPAGSIHFDSYALEAAHLAAGTYTVGVKIYYFTDGAAQNFAIVPCADAPTCEYYPIAQLQHKK